MRTLPLAAVDASTPDPGPLSPPFGAPEPTLPWCCHGMPVLHSPAEAREFCRGAGLVAKLATCIAAAIIGTLISLGIPLY